MIISIKSPTHVMGKPHIGIAIPVFDVNRQTVDCRGPRSITFEMLVCASGIKLFRFDELVIEVYSVFGILFQLTDCKQEFDHQVIQL